MDFNIASYELDPPYFNDGEGVSTISAGYSKIDLGRGSFTNPCYVLETL